MAYNRSSTVPPQLPTSFQQSYHDFYPLNTSAPRTPLRIQTLEDRIEILNGPPGFRSIRFPWLDGTHNSCIRPQYDETGRPVPALVYDFVGPAAPHATPEQVRVWTELYPGSLILMHAENGYGPIIYKHPHDTQPTPPSMTGYRPPRTYTSPPAYTPSSQSQFYEEPMTPHSARGEKPRRGRTQSFAQQQGAFTRGRSTTSMSSRLTASVKRGLSGIRARSRSLVRRGSESRPRRARSLSCQTPPNYTGNGHAPSADYRGGAPPRSPHYLGSMPSSPRYNDGAPPRSPRSSTGRSSRRPSLHPGYSPLSPNFPMHSPSHPSFTMHSPNQSGAQPMLAPHYPANGMLSPHYTGGAPIVPSHYSGDAPIVPPYYSGGSPFVPPYPGGSPTSPAFSHHTAHSPALSRCPSPAPSWASSATLTPVYLVTYQPQALSWSPSVVSLGMNPYQFQYAGWPGTI